MQSKKIEEALSALKRNKVGLFLKGDQFIEGILLNVKNDYLICEITNNVYYISLHHILAFSKNAKDNFISSEAVPYLNSNYFTNTLIGMKYNWVKINSFSNQELIGVLSKIYKDYIVLVNDENLIYVPHSSISSVFSKITEKQISLFNSKEHLYVEQSYIPLVNNSRAQEVIKIDKHNNKRVTEKQNLQEGTSVRPILGIGNLEENLEEAVNNTLMKQLTKIEILNSTDQEESPTDFVLEENLEEVVNNTLMEQLTKIEILNSTDQEESPTDFVLEENLEEAVNNTLMEQLTEIEILNSIHQEEGPTDFVLEENLEETVTLTEQLTKIEILERADQEEDPNDFNIEEKQEEATDIANIDHKIVNENTVRANEEEDSFVYKKVRMPKFNDSLQPNRQGVQPIRERFLRAANPDNIINESKTLNSVEPIMETNLEENITSKKSLPFRFIKAESQTIHSPETAEENDVLIPEVKENEREQDLNDFNNLFYLRRKRKKKIKLKMKKTNFSNENLEHEIITVPETSIIKLNPKEERAILEKQYYSLMNHATNMYERLQNIESDAFEKYGQEESNQKVIYGKQTEDFMLERQYYALMEFSKKRYQQIIEERLGNRA
ncbi:hypothetical protein [Psychrobacillus sp. NPDC093200]|uniref:hypothetical protein n=1 Tax=Psychrobacillus sp. NPDC093200 TaxID=3390656 RepID=UPI003CFF0A35